MTRHAPSLAPATPHRPLRALRYASWLALAVIALAPALARAEPSPLPELAVRAEPSAAAECPDAAALSATVEQLMGRPAFVPVTDEAGGAPHARPYEVHIAHGGFYTASITTPDGGQRDLSDPGPGCSGLTDAVALTLAILLDPEGRPPVPRAAHPHVRPKPRRAPPRPIERPTPEHGAWLSARAAGGAALGVLSSTTPAAWGGLDLRASRLLSIGAGVLFPAATSAEYASGNVDFALFAGYLRVCGPEIGRPETVRLVVCLEPMLGSLRVAGRGYDVKNLTSRPMWGALGLGATLDAHLFGPIGVFLDANALVAGRTQYTVKSASAPAPGELPRFGALLGGGLRVSIF